MNDADRNLRSIFCEALERPTPQEQIAFLDQACQGDSVLRARVEALLEAHAEGGKFLRESPPGTIEQPVFEGPGTQIGPYKLMEQIGEGGMGMVFVAEQHQPVRRKVALKLIKPGMDTRACIARFEAERQALALMDHPHIARVLDAGATASGRPYFVMELVKGVPITQYCDENRLTPRQRLELFTDVCHAVQHAHQKGIIHRDIKPNNVLVASHDGRPVVKVIDFGVAKAIGQQLTERTIYTGIAQMVGTPLYMSPEQAGMSGLDIDTRTDIYSLGVLLYELLTGTTPFDKERLKQAAYDEMRRIIREEEPQKPSTRISDLSSRHTPYAVASNGTRSVPATLASIAAQRHTEPAKLAKLVRGELDWIVMKCLEKDRNRRYETANGLGMDILRYLHDEHVLACPPSMAYRLHKFARRNKVAMTTTGVVALALVSGMLLATWQAIRATHAEGVAQELFEGEKNARQEADAARQQAEKDRDRARIAEKQAEANFQKAVEAVDQMLTEVGQESLANVPQMEPVRRALLEKALQFYQEFLQQKATEPFLRFQTGRAHQRLAEICFLLGKESEGVAANRQAIAILKKLEAEFPEQPDYQHELAESYRRRAHSLRSNPLLADGPGDYADRAYAQAIQRHEKLAQAFPNDVRYKHALSKDYHAFAYYLRTRSRREEAAKVYDKAGALYRELLEADPRSREYRESLGHHAIALGAAGWVEGRLKEAEDPLREAITLGQQLVADVPNDPRYQQMLGSSQYHLGQVLRSDGRHAEAEQILLESKAVRARLHANFPNVPEYRGDLAKTLQALSFVQVVTGKTEDAERNFRDSVPLLPSTASAMDHNNFAWSVAKLGELTPAQATWALERARQAVEMEPREGMYWNTLGVAQYRVGLWKEAIASLERAEQLRPGQSQGYNDLFIAMAHCQLGNRKAARSMYDRGVQWIETHAPQNVELRRFRAEAESLAMGRDAQAEAHYRRGFGLWNSGKMEEAIEACREAVRLNPEHSSAHYLLGVTLARQGDVEGAIDAYEETLRLTPNFAPAHHALGNALQRQGKFAEAAAAYSESIQHDPKYIAAHQELVLLLANGRDVKFRDPARAVASARKAVELAPANAVCSSLLGIALYRVGDWQGTLEALHKSIELRKGEDPRDAFFLAMAHWRLEHPQDAIDWHNKALDGAERSSPESELARLRAEAADIISAEAIVRWCQSVPLGEGASAKQHAARGGTLARINKLDEALDHFLKAIELAGTSVEENAESNQVYHTLMRWERLFQRLLERQGDSAHLWRERGRFLARRSRWKEAADAYAHAPQLDTFEHALAILLAGDSDGYRQLCTRLNEQFKQPPPASSAWHSAWVCALGKDSGIQPERIVSWAEAAVGSKRDKFTLHALAAAEYRAGRYDDAIQHAHETLDRQGSRSNVAFLMALAYRGAGNSAESHKWYEIGRSELERATPKNTFDPASWAIAHWLNVNVMAREAKAMFEDAGQTSK